jgi:segregation and condensation protein A
LSEVFKDDSVPSLPDAIKVQGAAFDNLPNDLYVPPDALKVFLEDFEGPLDLLLYLIQRQNFDILNIPIAEITRQYLQYVDLMKELHLDLAVEYLVMAAVLMEIKSRMLLPNSNPEILDPADPRTRLIQQLQEYAQYKQAAQNLAALPQLGREIFPVSVDVMNTPLQPRVIPNISLSTVLAAMQDVMARASLFSSHQVTREPLSVRERMSFILERLQYQLCIEFIDLFTLEEGRAGVVVTFLAILELVKESLVQLVQLQAFGTIQVMALQAPESHASSPV